MARSRTEIEYSDVRRPRKNRRWLAVLAAVLLALLVAIAIVLAVVFWPNSAPEATPAEASRVRSQTKTFASAAVVVDTNNCSALGLKTLQKNGSAVDAAIVTALCAGLMNRAGSGIGGGFLVQYYDRKTKRLYSLDARESAPLASNSTMYSNRPEAAMTGAMSVAVPGAIAGYRELHRRFGRLPWSELFEDAVGLCERGVELNRWNSMLLTTWLSERVKKFPNLMQLFTVDGQFGKVGSIIKDPPLAETLRRIANDSQAFYAGPLAEHIVADLQEAGSALTPSILTLEDLRSYTPKWRESIRFPWNAGGRKYTVALFPPPSGSAILPLVMNIMAIYQSECRSQNCPAMDDPLVVHRIVEAFKFAFAHRTKLADPDFVNTTDSVQQLLDLRLANTVRQYINDSATFANASHYLNSLTYLQSDGGTSQMSVIDAEGNAVSMTNTINYGYGSSVRGSRTGIIFNDEMGDFALPSATQTFGLPSNEANFIQPGKRPLSSMSPIIILDENDDVVVVTGSVGGTLILSTVLQPILRDLLYGEPLEQAFDKPRFHHQLIPNVLGVQPSFPKELRLELNKRGHKIEDNQFLDMGGAVQCLRVYRDLKSGTKRILAISDYRRPGEASGF